MGCRCPANAGAARQVLQHEDRCASGRRHLGVPGRRLTTGKAWKRAGEKRNISQGRSVWRCSDCCPVCKALLPCRRRDRIPHVVTQRRSSEAADRKPPPHPLTIISSRCPMGGYCHRRNLHYLWTSCSSATPGQPVPRFGGLGCSLKLWWLRPCHDLGQQVCLTLAWTFGPA